MPGKTVDSKKMISSFLIYLEIVLNAETIYFKSGSLFCLIGVGTVTIKKLQFFSSFSLLVILEPFLSLSSFFSNSLFESISLLRLVTLFLFKSNPITLNFFFHSELLNF